MIRRGFYSSALLNSLTLLILKTSMPCSAHTHTYAHTYPSLAFQFVLKVARAGRHHQMDDGLLLFVDEGGQQQQARYGTFRLAGAECCVKQLWPALL